MGQGWASVFPGSEAEGGVHEGLICQAICPGGSTWSLGIFAPAQELSSFSPSLGHLAATVLG